jgi:hypothetical protein
METHTYYQAYTTLHFTGAWDQGPYTVHLVKSNNKTVTISFPALTHTCTTTAHLISVEALPTMWRPATTRKFPTAVTNDAIIQPGLVAIVTDGKIHITRTLNDSIGDKDFTSGTVGGLVYPTTFTYGLD